VTYSYSLNGFEYYGRFRTRESALAAARRDREAHSNVFTARNLSLRESILLGFGDPKECDYSFWTIDHMKHEDSKP
jgi:hypothetical protein